MVFLDQDNNTGLGLIIMMISIQLCILYITRTVPPDLYALHDYQTPHLPSQAHTRNTNTLQRKRHTSSPCLPPLSLCPRRVPAAPIHHPCQSCPLLPCSRRREHCPPDPPLLASAACRLLTTAESSPPRSHCYSADVCSGSDSL